MPLGTVKFAGAALKLFVEKPHNRPATDLWQRRREMHAAMEIALWLPTHRTPVKMRRRLQRAYARYCSPESSPLDNTDLDRAEAALRDAGFHPEVYGRPAVEVEERCKIRRAHWNMSER